MPLPSSSIFKQHCHPFAWTNPTDRTALQLNAELPLWSRFLNEVDSHFNKRGHLTMPRFPIFCHDGDLDEVMALAVLAYVTGDRKHWGWIADWLKAFSSYFQQVAPLWQEHRNSILRGKLPTETNPGQWFEGFTKDGRYWVEAGLMSSILHLLDLLESEAPGALTEKEQYLCLEALSSYADRYAFHEEAVKYSNRGIWANAGILIAAITSSDPIRASVLLRQSTRRNEELRTTFFNDGMHCEGSSDYHLMALDGILCYTHLAETITGNPNLKDRKDGSELFGTYPSFVQMVKAVLQTALPGTEPWTHPRGSSVSVPLPLSPSLVYAYQITEDAEIGWFIKSRQEKEERRRPTPLAVTPVAILGLGSYQPLRNFWCYKEITSERPPLNRLSILKDHGGIFSRSGWEPNASTLTMRYGYQGSAKGHHDIGHVLIKVADEMLLCDPFPRHGPTGQHSSLFHNTVMVNGKEPTPSVGQLLQTDSTDDADSFLISTDGGSMPSRPHLHDPRDESNYWFVDKPSHPEFLFHRAVLHLHEKCVVGIDVVNTHSDPEDIIDWFFHTHLRPANYDKSLPERQNSYQLRPRNILDKCKEYNLATRGEIQMSAPGQPWKSMLQSTSRNVSLSLIPIDCEAQIESGHHYCSEHRSADGIQYDAETDYFVRCRSRSDTARLLWIVDWSNCLPSIRWKAQTDSITVQIDSTQWHFNIPELQIELKQTT